MSPATTPLAAQSRALMDPPRWRVTSEVGAVVGGTWLEGRRAPRVATSLGAVAGLGVLRAAGEYLTAGAGLRIGRQQLRIRESGESWKGGGITEANALANVSLHSRTRSATRIALDLSGGAAILGGAADILPFQDAATLGPLVEIGLSLHRGETDGDASRRSYALLLRYSALRLDANIVNAVTTTGWVGRTVLGLKVIR